MSILDSLRPPRTTHDAEYWIPKAHEPWFIYLRRKRVQSVDGLAKELAIFAQDHGLTDEQLIVQGFKELYGLTLESRWRPETEWPPYLAA